MSKCTASMDFKNRHCFVKCSHRRWAVFHTLILFNRDGNPTAPTPGWLSEQKEKQAYKPACPCWRLKSCEDGGRNPFIGIKVKHLNVLFILNFFLFLEGCNLIKTIILWSSSELSRKFQKKTALFKLLPRMKHFIIIALNLLEDSAFISRDKDTAPGGWLNCFQWCHLRVTGTWNHRTFDLFKMQLYRMDLSFRMVDLDF